jgi:hypothetical protein
MKVSTENDNNFGYEKITILVDNIPLRLQTKSQKKKEDYVCYVIPLKINLISY